MSDDIIPPLFSRVSGTLRNRYGASNANSAFDEFAHTADLRRGAQSSGWYNISHLGVFI